MAAMLFKRIPHARGAARSGCVVSRQAGASLVEVLVTVVLLSFGLVGMAGLQFKGVTFNHTAYLRSQATSLAYDLADRARANLDACLSGGNVVCAYLTPQDAAFDGKADQACGRGSADAVDPLTMAKTDVNQWKSCLEDLLPGGQGQVVVLGKDDAYRDACGLTHDSAGREALVIEVNWLDRRLAGAEGRDCVVVRTEVRPLR